MAVHNHRAGGNWQQPDFDDSAWQSGPAGFGTEGTPGAVVRTAWNGSDIWLRRKIQLDSLPEDGDIMLHIHHDEDAEIYLNGKLVRRLRGHTTSYRPVALSDDAREVLEPAKTPSRSIATKPAAGNISTWDCWRCASDRQ